MAKTLIGSIALLASVNAFVPTSFVGSSVSRNVKSSSALTMSVSDMVGADVETGGEAWDPLGLSGGNLYKYRECELKHGRVAMLAVTGEIVQGIIRLPDPVFDEPRPLAALAKVFTERPEALWQIFLFLGFLELNALKQDPSKAPGDIGGSNVARYSDPKIKDEKLRKELKNGRLAMLAIMGEWAGELVTGQGPLEQWAVGHTNPFGDGQGFF